MSYETVDSLSPSRKAIDPSRLSRRMMQGRCTTGTFDVPFHSR